METLGGYMGHVIKLDLLTKTVDEYPWSYEDRVNFLGGKLMATKIISDLVSPETNAYDEGNVVVISTGPLTLTGAPSSSRFNVSTISPTTNLIEASNCGGSFGLMLKKAGYDAVIITGKANDPMWIEINENEILFHNANDLWGMPTFNTEEKLEAVTNKSIQLVIGPAGENLITYAGLYSERRSLGKGGMGAVFGAKNLKAITVTGEMAPYIVSYHQFKKFNTRWISSLQHKRGLILSRMDEKYGSHTYASLHNNGCITCPIQCDRVYSYEKQVIKGKELEKLSYLGAHFGIDDMKMMLEWKFSSDNMGLDTISFVNIILDALKKNKLKLESVTQIQQVIEDITYKRGIGKELSELNIKPNKHKNKLVSFIENLREAISATGICLFTLYGELDINNEKWLKESREGLLSIYLSFVLPYKKALKLVTGMNITVKKLNEVGDRGINLEKNYNSKREVFMGKSNKIKQLN